MHYQVIRNRTTLYNTLSSDLQMVNFYLRSFQAIYCKPTSYKPSYRFKVWLS